MKLEKRTLFGIYFVQYSDKFIGLQTLDKSKKSTASSRWNCDLIFADTGPLIPLILRVPTLQIWVRHSSVRSSISFILYLQLLRSSLFGYIWDNTIHQGLQYFFRSIVRISSVEVDPFSKQHNPTYRWVEGAPSFQISAAFYYPVNALPHNFFLHKAYEEFATSSSSWLSFRDSYWYTPFELKTIYRYPILFCNKIQRIILLFRKFESPLQMVEKDPLI